MRRHIVLTALSAVQLGAGIAGHVIARRERRTFDIAVLGWRGDPDRVARDSWFLGTGLSGPALMLATQAVATARLATGPSPHATHVLGLLGAMMCGGYLVEREARAVLAPSGWHPVRTPVVVVGLATSVAMAAAASKPTRA